MGGPWRQCHHPSSSFVQGRLLWLQSSPPIPPAPRSRGVYSSFALEGLAPRVSPHHWAPYCCPQSGAQEQLWLQFARTCLQQTDVRDAQGNPRPSGHVLLFSPCSSSRSPRSALRRAGDGSWESGKEVALNSRAPGRIWERNPLVCWPQNVLREPLLTPTHAQHGKGCFLHKLFN